MYVFICFVTRPEPPSILVGYCLTWAPIFNVFSAVIIVLLLLVISVRIDVLLQSYSLSLSVISCQLVTQLSLTRVSSLHLALSI